MEGQTNEGHQPEEFDNDSNEQGGSVEQPEEDSEISDREQAAESLLPLVKNETRFAVLREYEEDQQYTANLLHRLENENPGMAQLIADLSQRDVAKAEALCLLYRVIESQAEADELNKNL
jgi:hypothetical protein